MNNKIKELINQLDLNKFKCKMCNKWLKNKHMGRNNLCIVCGDKEWNRTLPENRKWLKI